MSTDPGSFAVHFPCRCVDCALRHGDQAEDSESDELVRLRREVAELKVERACILATRKFWPRHVREAIRARDLERCSSHGEEGEKFIAGLQASHDAARDDAAAARRERHTAIACRDSMLESWRQDTEDHQRCPEFTDDAVARAESIACGWVFDAVRNHELIPEAEALEQCALAATMVRERCARLVEDLGWSDVEELHGRHSYNPCTNGNATLKNIAAAIRGNG